MKLWKWKLKHWYYVNILRADLPPKMPLNMLKPRRGELSNRIIGERCYKVYALYIAGLSIEEIASFYQVTRERIRQMVWKEFRTQLKIMEEKHERMV